MSVRVVLVLALAFALGFAPGARAEGPDAYQATSEPLPEGVETTGPDALTTQAESPDDDLAEAQDPDSITVGSSPEVIGHSVDPDAITTTAQDVDDLPQADQEPQPGEDLPPPPSLPLVCGQPAGDAGWSQCLAAVQAQLDDAQQRLAAANAALSRSITLHYPVGQPRYDAIRNKDIAQRDIPYLQQELAQMVEQARQAGVSDGVTSPYQPAPASGW